LLARFTEVVGEAGGKQRWQHAKAPGGHGAHALGEKTIRPSLQYKLLQKSTVVVGGSGEGVRHEEGAEEEEGHVNK
jgi:hypothetical protein